MEMELVIIGIALFVLISIAVHLSKSQPSSKEGYYIKKKTLLTPAERSFYGVLKQAIPEEIEITCKVRIADVLTPKKGMSRSNWQTAFNQISAKHFDYVLCSTTTLEVLAVVELDDKSHNKPSRVKRDELILEACESADLPLIRFPAKAAYTVDGVRNAIIEAIDTPKEYEL